MTQKQWAWLGFIFTLVLGTMLHFTYEWSHNSSLIGFFSAVNESTWEHLKLLFVPTFIFSILEYAFLRKTHPAVFITNLVGSLLGMLTIVTLFYTYMGILGFNLLVLDIFVFVIGCGTTYLYSYFALNKHWLETPFLSKLGLYGNIFLFLLFAIFTFIPPNIGLFHLL